MHALALELAELDEEKQAFGLFEISDWEHSADRTEEDRGSFVSFPVSEIAENPPSEI